MKQSHKVEIGNGAYTPSKARVGKQPRICMHVDGTARTDGRVMREARTLQQAGYAVTIVDVERDLSRPREETFTDIRLKHIRMRSAFTPTRFKPWFLVKAARTALQALALCLRTPADVYHAQDTTALPACYIAARLRRKPLIFDAHELPLVEPNITKWRRLSTVAVRAFRTMMPRCSLIITVSPPIVREIQRRYGGSEAVLVRNVPVYQKPVRSDRLRQRLGLDEGARIALYQGNLQPDRGLDRLVRAAKYLTPGHVIVMMGGGATRGALETLIEREEVGDRVKLLPPVPYEELLEWTASADLGLIVYPQSYSLNVQMCLPNKLFEYVMAGLPILASPLDAVREIIDRYGVGAIVPSLEDDQVGHAINTLLSDDASRERMRDNAVRAAQTDLCWEQERQVLLQAYEHIVPISPWVSLRAKDDPTAVSVTHTR